MRSPFSIRMWSCVAILLGASALACFGAQPGTLSVGAAKVDLTPPADAALPMSGYDNRKQGFQSIHDHIYARAIVLSDGKQKAAILAWELIAMPDQVWQDISQRISNQLDIPVDDIMLVGEHVHSAPTISGAYVPGTPETIAYTKKVEDLAFQAVSQANANLQPARFGYGTGKAYININRREQFPNGGWWLGYNPNGPSDKTVWVLKFETLTGKPIAFFINYSVHGVVMGSDNLQISGDLPGATSRYIEQYYQGKYKIRNDAGWALQPNPQDKSQVVALWTSGPAGDQNPIVMDTDEDFSMVDALGRILGEESVRVANQITSVTSNVTIRTAPEQVVTCPGRRRVSKLGGPVPSTEMKFASAKPGHIRLSLLMLNDVALTGVSAEVLTPIFWRLKRESPFTHTMMITHANGLSGYIPADDQYGQDSYEVQVTHFAPGCAEGGIVNGLVNMMTQRY